MSQGTLQVGWDMPHLVLPEVQAALLAACTVGRLDWTQTLSEGSLQPEH